MLFLLKEINETRMKIKNIGVKREWRRELFFLKTYAKQTSTLKKLMGEAWLLSWKHKTRSIRGTSWTSRKTRQSAGLSWAKRTTERSLIRRWCASLLDCSHTPHLSTASTAVNRCFLAVFMWKLECLENRTKMSCWRWSP